MRKLIPATLAVAALFALTPAFAEDAATAAPEATAEIAAPETAGSMDEAVAPVVTEYTLKDGTTKVSVEGEHVFVVGADGAKTAAPDGDHETTTEGVTLKVLNGMLVTEGNAASETPAADVPAEAPSE